MTRQIILQGPRRIGDLAVAAVVEQAVQVHALGGGVAGSATLRPLAILVADADGLRGWQPDGTPLQPGAIADLCPGAGAALAAALQDKAGGSR